MLIFFFFAFQCVCFGQCVLVAVFLLFKSPRAPQGYLSPFLTHQMWFMWSWHAPPPKKKKWTHLKYCTSFSNKCSLEAEETYCILCLLLAACICENQNDHKGLRFILTDLHCIDLWLIGNRKPRYPMLILHILSTRVRRGFWEGQSRLNLWGASPPSSTCLQWCSRSSAIELPLHMGLSHENCKLAFRLCHCQTLLVHHR